MLLLLCAAAGIAHAGAAAAADGMKERLKACAACHGDGGRTHAEVYYPSIAGKPAGYLYAQLLNFRDGRRSNATMQAMLGVLSDDYLRAMAVYYAAQTPALAAPDADFATAAKREVGRRLVLDGDPARDIPRCSACHGASLTGAVPAVPGLLGLRPEYLSAQLGAWRVGVRHAAAPDCMATIAQRLSQDEIDGVTAWIASQPYPRDHRPPPLPGELPVRCGSVP
jgi:cytochrome c553